MTRMKSYYATFGCNHEHPNCYVLIHAPNSMVAAASMDRVFGSKGHHWSTLYDESEWNRPSVQVYMGNYQLYDEWTVGA